MSSTRQKMKKMTLIIAVVVLAAIATVVTNDVNADVNANVNANVLNRLSLYSDPRLRHETDTNLDDQPTRNRQRVRFRLGADYLLTNEVLIGARLTTGNLKDPNSPHQTMGDVFHTFEINLDRVFVTYRPRWASGLWITAGKFVHPLWSNPVYGELVWDADVQPEGVTLGYSFKRLGLLEQLDLKLGEYIILEQRLAKEAWAFVAQTAAHAKFGKYWKPSIAIGYYRYTDLTPDGSLTVLTDNSGNATVGTGASSDFRSRFEILNPIVGVTYNGWRYPITVSGEYIFNTQANSNEDEGWTIGAAIGSAKKKGAWRLYYQWQVVEQDAVMSIFAQDDFLFQTNHRSHIFGLNYQLMDNIGLHLWGLISARDETFPGLTTDSDKNQWRLRTDLNIKL